MTALQPAAGSPGPPPAQQRPLTGRLALGVLLLAAGLLWLADLSAVTDLDAAVALPALLMGVGVGQLVSARSGGHPGLWFAGAAMTVLLMLSAFTPLGPIPDVGSGTVGDRTVAPTSVAELAELDDLGLTAGELTLDLRGLPVGQLDQAVHASVGAGELLVQVPQGVDVELRADVGVGQLRAFGLTRSGAGVSVDERFTAPASSGDVLELDLSVGAGELEVRR